MQDQPAVIVRDMEPDESKALYKTALRSFNLVEAMGASKPKDAVVATVDGEIAGAVFLKTMALKGERQFGYLDLGFVTKKHRGKGIGGMLYPAAVEKLKRDGCDIVGAMVKDDNVASWGLLAKQGFSKPDYPRFLRELGVLGGISVWLRTIYCIACGMNFWLSTPGQERSIGRELASFFLCNLVLIGLRIGSVAGNGGGFVWQEGAAYFAVLGVCILAGLLGAAIGGGRWRFSLNRGGLLLSAGLVLLGTCFPLLGRWYPAVYENTANRPRAMGVQALCEWIGLLALSTVAYLGFPDSILGKYVFQYGSMLLVYHMLAFYPFEHFGGGRIWRWSRPVFIGLAAVTCGLIIFL